MPTMDITTFVIYDDSFDNTSIRVFLLPSDPKYSYLVGSMFNWGGHLGTPADHPNLIFSDFQDAIDFYVNREGQDMVNYIQSLFGITGVTLGNIYDDTYKGTLNLLIGKVDKIVGKGLSTEDYSTAEKTKLSGIATGATANDTDSNLKNRGNHTGTQSSSTISDFSTAADARITAQKGAASGLASLDSGGKVPTSQLPAFVPSLTFGNPTRSLNSAFQPSTTLNAIVSYSVDIACTLSLTGGQAGTVFLRYADDSGHTTNVKEVCRFAATNTGTLTIGLALNQIATGTLSGVIPAGKYVKLVTSNDTGTPTFTYRNAQEVLI